MDRNDAREADDAFSMAVEQARSVVDHFGGLEAHTHTNDWGSCVPCQAAWSEYREAQLKGRDDV